MINLSRANRKQLFPAVTVALIVAIICILVSWLIFRIRISNQVDILQGDIPPDIRQLVKQDGYGQGDLVPAVIWTIPFAVLSGLFFGLFSPTWRRLPLLIAYSLVAVLSVLGTLLWATLVTVSLGPTVGAFSIAPAAGWQLGCLAAVLVGVSVIKASTVRNRQRLFSILYIAALVGVPLVTTAATYRLLESITDQSQPSFITIKWINNSDDMVIDDPGELLSQEERERLNSLNLGGNLIVRSIILGIGSLRDTRIIVLMQGPTDKEVMLPIPNHTSIIYIQQVDSWTKYPQNAPTISKVVKLRPHVTTNGYIEVDYCLDFWRITSCNGAFSWPPEQ